jgi:hypothetical protein
MIPKSGNRFPAFAKPASAGEVRSDKIMRKKNFGVTVLRHTIRSNSRGSGICRGFGTY